MNWIKKTDSWWLAHGKHGKFSIYRERGGWKGCYQSPNGTVLWRLPWRKTIKEIKTLCEENYHWEA